ncbi:MAG: D-aminoacyl-tRNA deacylase [Pseudomonadota bacterium]
MIALIQRVSRASVTVDGARIAKIDAGLLVLLGVQRADNTAISETMAGKVANYRVFADDSDKMNLSVLDVDGAVLMVPQFTLAADTSRGRRPSFGSAAAPELGKTCFDSCVAALRNLDLTVETGAFGANMQVELVNNGPVTFWLQSGAAP